ncbi:MAG: aminopeptidase P N-terminal domain-containing protein [Flavobacteriales bacterium]|nr:aminopeptidase P N-terminal domain-containing protein [Flavobacteriales bacterium]
MRSIILTSILSLIAVMSTAQTEELEFIKEKNYYQYDADFLPASFHKARRDSIRAALPDSSAMVLFANPERNRSNDVYYEYHQDPNFYYLTGLREPNAMLILYKEEQEINGKKVDELLLMQARNPSSEIWNGRRLGVDKAAEELLFDQVLANTSFQDLEVHFNNLKSIYYEAPYSLEEQKDTDGSTLSGLYKQFKAKDSTNTKSSELLAGMLLSKFRQIKTKEEIALLRKAIAITCEAQNELMRTIQPNMAEYETEAIIEYVFKKNGAEYPGFPSIQGSGENSCILHYTSNRRPLKNGGLLVSDVGAEYRGYTADVTRTIPPNGKFSKEEKQIYELVLKAQTAGIEASVVGASFWAPGQVATEIIGEGLKKLGIIKHAKEVKKYFMHGTSHYLGLDVHDAGMYMPLEAGNVITVEPGIYIAEDSDCDPKWWNIGVRIEDDILILEKGPENLSASSPRTVKEIEALMLKSK